MKFRLIAKNRIPYGGMWRTKDRLTGMAIEGNTFDIIRQRVFDSRKANGYPIGIGMDEEIEQWLCEDMPVECLNVDPDMPRKRDLGMDDVVRGTQMLVGLVKQWALHIVGLADHPLVEQDEANRRAAICSKCPFNVTFRKPCTGLCPELAVLVNTIKLGRATPYDHELKSCSVCGCLTQAHVWPRLDILARGVNETQKKQFGNVPGCWKQL